MSVHGAVPACHAGTPVDPWVFVIHPTLMVVGLLTAVVNQYWFPARSVGCRIEVPVKNTGWPKSEPPRFVKVNCSRTAPGRPFASPFTETMNVGAGELINALKAVRLIWSNV